MRGDYSVFPLLFVVLIVVSLLLTFAIILSAADTIGIEHAGIRSAAVLHLYAQEDRANSFIETAVRIATREAVAQQELKQRYPCERIGSFSDASSCDVSLFDEERFGQQIDSGVLTRVNDWVEYYPRALLPSVEITRYSVEGSISYRVESSAPAVFFLDDLYWDSLGRQQDSGPFKRVDAPVHTARIKARSEVSGLFQPAIERRRSFDTERFEALVSEALTEEGSYCDDDAFAPFVAAQRIADLADSCIVSETVCSCGDVPVPDARDYSIAFKNDHVILSNGVYEVAYDSRASLNETDAPIVLDGSHYLLLMRESNVSIVRSDDVEEFVPTCVDDPKINVFSTIPYLFEQTGIDRDGLEVNSSEIFRGSKGNVALYECEEEYEYTSGSSLSGVPNCVEDHVVRDRGVNVIVLTHPSGTRTKYSTNLDSGLLALIDMRVAIEGLYPSFDARLDYIAEELGFETTFDETGSFDLDEAIRKCESRIHSTAILKDSYLIEPNANELFPKEALPPNFFHEIIETGAPYLIVSLPLEFTDECMRERSIEFAPPDANAEEIQEMLLRAVVDGAVSHLSGTRPGRLVCLDDPVTKVTHHPFLGYERYQIYPYVIVPEQPPDFIWPLEDIGRFTQCWGPPMKPWGFDDDGKEITPPYDFHRGLDLQPFGPRYNMVTVRDDNAPSGQARSVWDRFSKDAPVVAIAEGTVVSYSECPYSEFFEFGEHIDRETRMAVAQMECSGRDPLYSPGGFGEHLVIDHDGYYAIYAHLAPGSIRLMFGLEPPSVVGDLNILDKLGSVSAGQPLGIVGNTGTSTGAHLHFEIYPKPDSGVYPPGRAHVPPAYRYTQFNPFCVLPQEVEADGSTFDISRRMPGGERRYASDDPPTSTTDDDVQSEDSESESDSSGFDRPSSLEEQCFYNYAMAYYNYNPSPRDYGFCP